MDRRSAIRAFVTRREGRPLERGGERRAFRGSARERGGERFGVGVRDRQAELARAADVRRDDRDARRERFQLRDAHAFVEARREENVRRRKERRDVRARADASNEWTHSSASEGRVERRARAVVSFDGYAGDHDDGVARAT
jgi:hypothetical protein